MWPQFGGNFQTAFYICNNSVEFSHVPSERTKSSDYKRGLVKQGPCMPVQSCVVAIANSRPMGRGMWPII